MAAPDRILLDNPFFIKRLLISLFYIIVVSVPRYHPFLKCTDSNPPQYDTYNPSSPYSTLVRVGLWHCFQKVSVSAHPDMNTDNGVTE